MSGVRAYAATGRVATRFGGLVATRFGSRPASRLLRLAVVLAPACTASACGAQNEGAPGSDPARNPRPAEIVMYMGGSGERALDTFRAHADLISIVAPQAYRADSAGNVSGEVHPGLLATAREHGVAVMPLIVNPGFDQPLIHALLNNPAARRQAVDAMVALAREHGFWGWQFDFENIHRSDRDSLTAFYRETAEALHAAGLGLSIAVVPPHLGDVSTPFHAYMRDNWRGSFDLAALAEAGDFISFMTYAQHGGPTAPGPIAGLPWMRAELEHALGLVPPEKLSLGIPSYSGHWLPTHDEARGARVAGREIPYSRARSLLDSAGTALHWLAREGVHYAFWENGGVFEWLFLEDRRSLEAKLDLLGEHPRLRGISVWVLGAEDPELWEVLGRRLTRRPASR